LNNGSITSSSITASRKIEKTAKVYVSEEHDRKEEKGGRGLNAYTTVSGQILDLLKKGT